MTLMKSWSRLLVCGALILELASCTTSRSKSTPVPTVGFVSEETIAQACRQHTTRRSGTAGFEMLHDGKEAFLARLAAVEAAQRTLDVQYYIWSDDVVGTTFAERLLAAADRGVKVRLLLDSASDAQAEIYSYALAAHPNIQVAFFNPLSDLKGIFAGNPIPVIGEIDRMQCRMHNKLLVADGNLFIGGGRNLGDTYFGIHGRHNMRDLDFIATGPVVGAATKSFDFFWRSPLTRIGDVTKTTDRDREKLQDLRKRLARKKRSLASKSSRAYPLSLSRAEAVQTLRQFVGRMIWAEYNFVADPPERMLHQTQTASPVWHSIEDTLRHSKHEVVMHAAYFIPQDDTLELMRQNHARGVHMHVLTNSLASIDQMAAMTGIVNRRPAVLDSGVDFYELNARAADRRSYLHTRRLTPLGMHTKGFVVDDQVSLIGSCNMDPRSKYINTETCVVIRSKAFAARMKTYLQKVMEPENSWRITRDANGSTLWTGRRANGQPAVHHVEPRASPARRIGCWFLRFLPWENFL